ncbi:MAG TPA: nucleoside diphosphate kinase regulator [Spirochaetota bacterium]|nr:nucleoside diphosphate kinase regulator [Spirochaetota bacterium]HPL15934.1 nucleoside diphosphate kinase regulator [Spirochaetota bacterium]HPV42170.1 nucleoside diphosphate kinase regulator [Spirochaetota bacterium]
MLNNNEILITKYDYGRIMILIDHMRNTFSKEQKENAVKLNQELQRAHKVSSMEIPADYVTMNSIFEIKEKEEIESRIFNLVFPDEANSEQDRISILSPIGTAVIGCRVGNVINWNVPGGLKKFVIINMIYQPEAAGNYNL